MSLWNCGSFSPNEVEFANRIQFCHWADTPVPMMSAKKSETDTRTRPEYGCDVAAVALDDLVFGTGAPAVRRDAIGDDQVHEHHDEEDDREDERRHELRRQQRPPRVGEPDILEPEVVGVEAGEPSKAQQQHDENDGGKDQPASQTERTSTAFDRHNMHWAG